MGAIWLSNGETVLKMTLINFGKRPRWNLYSARTAKDGRAAAAFHSRAQLRRYAS